MSRRARRWICRVLRCHQTADIGPPDINEPEGVRGFNLCTVYILGRLYGAFPEPVDLNMNLEVVSAAVDEAGSGGVALRAKYIGSTVRWLANHGYVDVESTSLVGDYSGVELSEKAFKVLGLIPTSLRPALVDKPKPLGELMREAAITQGVGLPRDLVLFFLGAAGTS